MKKSRDENHTFCATRPNSSRPFYATRPSSSRLFFCIINFLKILLLILRYSFETKRKIPRGFSHSIYQRKHHNQTSDFKVIRNDVEI